jgi:hypothetical protein
MPAEGHAFSDYQNLRGHDAWFLGGRVPCHRGEHLIRGPGPFAALRKSYEGRHARA